MNLVELQDLVQRTATVTRDGVWATGIERVLLAHVRDASGPTPSLAEPILALCIQGSKRIALGEQIYDQVPGSFMTVAVDLPITGAFVEATHARPYLGFGLLLDASVVASLLVDAAEVNRAPRIVRATGISVGTASDDLVDAVARMVKLVERPRDAAVLAPMVEREILWHVLTGPHGWALRQIGLADSSLSHMGRAITHIRSNAFEPLHVHELASIAGMAVSSFHRQFRAVTEMSPIQYQKRIRLQEARLRLLRNPRDIAGVGHSVGYGSASQFSREYRREFGLSPRMDAVRLRDLEESTA
jgi:AraC-like DNA-binding protein